MDNNTEINQNPPEGNEPQTPQRRYRRRGSRGRGAGILGIPPLVAVLTVTCAYMLSSRGAGSKLTGMNWFVIVALFLSLSVLYMWEMKRGQGQWLLPLQLLAQGTLLAPLSMSLGGKILPWVGVIMIVVGMVISLSLMFSSTSTTGQPNTYKVSVAGSMFDRCPFPVMAADNSSVLLAVSDGMLDLLGKSREELAHTSVKGLTPSGGRIQLKEKFWNVRQLSYDEKQWVQYIESNLGDSADESVDEDDGKAMVASVENEYIKDPETLLYTRAYALFRTDEEVSRIIRYKRWATFVMVDFTFAYAETHSPTETKKKEIAFFRSYCIYIKNKLRKCDVVCRAGEYTMFIIMPETVGGDSISDVYHKIGNFSTPLDDLIKQIKGDICMHVSYVFFNATTPEMNYDQITKTLEGSLIDYDYS